MASSLALRRAAAAAASSGVLSRLTNPVRAASVAPHVARSFNTSSQMRRYDEDDSDVDVERRSDRAVSRRREPGLFSGNVFDPFSPTRSLSQVLNLMDQFMESPFLAASRGMGAAGSRRGWDVKEDDSALYLRMDMPGLSREDVKVSVEQNTLTIKGEGEKESEEEEESGRRYSSRLDLPPNLYKLGEIKAEMKNGVLKVVVPKVKEEERKDVFQVNIE
ncbi:small heat shock protein, chloroplastic isoform X1 [Eucalyptus grandis]|uniref:small heat shock protein, chloroplastic isoform X1 n=1 Tax=Eucalyptus grandis TaxID=71139 RepID=UPI00192EE7D5|nr:small heat shock protein, chloroplastic isoform X1 [Eucalyptus grandis]